MLTTTITGPSGGEWVRTTSTQRVVYARCHLCGRIVTEGWSYYVGHVSHAHVCLTCADDPSPSTDEEAPMTGTAGITPAMLTEVALTLEAAHLDWEQGRATSPDTSDYVLLTEQVLTQRIGPEYLWLGESNREQVADALYEAQCDGQLNGWAEMAEWLSIAVTAGHDLGHEGEAA